ncbi:IclR family transcriptional regulator [Novosphingobium mathurense]|uniref:Transcriptional regulator, IclR family n=1 Tax=Novosphingobium mathurense TaxID=428990 RepID=A0A1U6IM03_9SPHN|nr:IclR family transcriptional regulator [Novosphingobium mathurense]SLK09014.1 transcriptional regulator, IclR family [Novosphingobium mathurense]
MSQDNLKSLVKAAAVLDCFSTVEQQLSVAEIAKRIGIPRGTANRIIRTLKELGYLEQERQRDQFRLGMKLFGLGNTVLANMELQHEARSTVEALTRVSGETVHLAVFDGVHSTVINRTDADGSSFNTRYVLEASPAHATSTGKAALAFQSPAEIERFISLGLRRFTEQTIVDPDHLRQELQAIRERGYAFDDGELTDGVKCIGAPIHNSSGRVFAAISISGISDEFTTKKIDLFSSLVVNHADLISSRLGYDPEIENVNK